MSLRADDGEIVGLIGPNGSGKSSLLRAVYRVLQPQAGLVNVDGADVWALSAREAAKRTAVVTQERGSDFEFTVRELVAMGRTPHKGPFDRDTPDDARRVDEALARVDLVALGDRPFGTLPGGKKQRALAALHDLNLAALYCDRLYLLEGGRIVCEGSPGEVLTPERIAAVYGVEAVVHRRTNGRPHIVFEGLLANGAHRPSET